VVCYDVRWRFLYCC